MLLDGASRSKLTQLSGCSKLWQRCFSSKKLARRIPFQTISFRNKIRAIADGAKQILEEDHFKIIYQLTLREVVDHEEDSDNDDIEDRSDGKESLDEDSDLEEDEEET